MQELNMAEFMQQMWTKLVAAPVITCRAWKMTQDTLFTWPRSVSTSHAFVSATIDDRCTQTLFGCSITVTAC